MTYLLRLSACLLLCVSLNSFGALYGLTYSGTYGINPDTGVTTQLSGAYGARIPHHDGGGSLTSVPLPAGIYLFLSGLVGLWA